MDAPQEQATRPGRSAAIPFLLIVSIGLYANSLGNALVWDDARLITLNERLGQIRDPRVLFRPSFWRESFPAQARYRPLRTLSFLATYALWGVKPLPYHATNVLLHALAVALSYAVLLRLFGRRTMAFLAALFFATHPVQTEAINLVKNRSDLMCCCFFLLAWLLFVKALVPGRRGAIAYAASLAAYVLAMLCKEVAVVLPGVLLLYCVLLCPGKTRKRAALRVLPFMVAGLVYGLLLLLVVSSPEAGEETLAPIGFGAHVQLVIHTLGTYARLLCFPARLCADRPFGAPGFGDAAMLLSMVAGVLAGFAVIRGWQRWPLASFCVLYSLVTLLPVSNIVRIPTRPIAEQRLYLPSLGFCLLLAGIVTELGRAGGKRCARILTGLAVSFSVLLPLIGALHVVSRNRAWHTERSFWRDALAKSPSHYRPYYNLGKAYDDQGLGDRAEILYGKCLQRKADHYGAHAGLGTLFFRRGQLRRALEEFRVAAEIKPTFSLAQNNLGATHYEAGQTDKAIEQFQKALELDEEMERAHFNLGLAYYRKGEYQKALRSLERALELEPGVPNIRWKLAETYVALGIPEMAEKQLADAQKLQASPQWVGVSASNE